MARRLLYVVVAVTIGDLALAWTLTHMEIALFGVGAWWLWVSWNGEHRSQKRF